MSIEKRRKIASIGGKRAQQLGVAHQWNATEARAAGRKGGQKSAIALRERQAEDDRARMDSDKG